MKKQWISSMAAWMLGGMALAQAPTPEPPAETKPVPVETGPVFQGQGYAVTDNAGPLAGWFNRGFSDEPPGYTYWGSFEYLMWRFRGSEVPIPLVTTSTQSTDTTTGVVPKNAGVVGDPATRVLFGNQDLHQPSWQSGFRLTLGCWLDRDMSLGVEGSGFYFNHPAETQFAITQKDPSKILAIPFISTGPAGDTGNFANGGGGANTLGNPAIPQNTNNSFLLAGGLTPFGPTQGGSVIITSTSIFWAAEANGVFNVLRDSRKQLSLLVGFRYLDLNESLNIAATTFDTSGIAGPNLTGTFTDQFRTRNQYYAANLGMRGQWTNGILFASATAKVGLGVNHENVNILGSYADPEPFLFGTLGNFGAGPGGLFAQRTNIGNFYHNRFAVNPEVDLRVGVNLLSNLKIFAGYDFLYLNNVVRPGTQIDPHINVTQMGSSTSAASPAGGAPGKLVGAPQPGVLFTESPFWAQGINFGLQFTY